MITKQDEIETTRSRITARTALWITAILIVIVVFLISLFTFWRVQDPAILEVNKKAYPFSVRPGTNAPGQSEFLAVDYCKTYKARGTVVARMVGKKSIIRIPWPDETQPPQCLKTEFPIVIPTYAIDDDYYFDFTVTYEVNPIKDKVVYLRSETFNVSAGQE